MKKVAANQAIGVKLIEYIPMTRAEYNAYRGWETPSDENPGDEGYLVEYLDSPNSNHPNHEGYISWSPKDVFDRAYRPVTGMSFGLAIEALKKGHLVARKGWNGKGMFLFMRPSDEIDAQFIPNIKSLPEKFKSWFGKQEYPIQPESPKLKFGEYLCMKAADNSVVNGWLASQSDILADDWFIID